MYNHLCNKDSVAFWKAWKKRYCSQNVKSTGHLNGQVGDKNIWQVFTDHFKSLYQPNTPGADWSLGDNIDKLPASSSCEHTPAVEIETISTCIGSMKHHKTPGHDGITNEHIIYSTSSLLVHISLLFNACLRHGFVPNDYCFGVIVPLLKNKHGDASKLDMYRGITLSCTISKLFESVLSSVFEHWLITDDLQFGFKKHSIYSHALFKLKESVKYFVRKDSKVFCVSLDASKAHVPHMGYLLRIPH